MKRTIITLFLFSLVLLVSACETLPIAGLFSNAQKPQIQSIASRVAGLDLQGVDLLFDLDVLNPYSVPIKSPRFKYGIDIEGADLLNSEAISKLDLPANGVGTVVLPVRLNYTDLWRSYQNLKDADEISYNLHGALVFSPLGKTIELPMQKSGSFPIMRLPKFSAVNVAKPEISFGNAKISVNANLLNPNAFSLGLDNLGYDLQIGDIKLAGLKTNALKALKAGESQQLTLTGEISGLQAVQQLLSGGSLGKAKILPWGSVTTPYGTINLPK